MMQCASCETQITAHAAETGVCPKCGMPLPGSGGTMRFDSRMLADLQDVASQSPAAADGGLEQNLGARTLAVMESAAPPAVRPAIPESIAPPPAAPPATSPPTAPKSIDDTQ